VTRHLPIAAYRSGRLTIQSGVFFRHEPESRGLPILFELPQSGTVYPNDFSAAASFQQLHFLVSPYVEELLGGVVAQGCTLLQALFPMTYINANRGPSDIDQSMLEKPWPDAQPSQKVALGLGLIQKLARPGVPIYDRRLTVAEVSHRIESYYEPYHQEIARILASFKALHGGAWHLDCHCMGTYGSTMSPDPGRRRADFCIGDRDGSTSDSEFLECVVGLLRGMGYSVAVNDPFKGVEIIRRHGNPEKRVNSLQMEIGRGLFLNESTNEPSANFASLSDDINRLAKGVGEFVRDKIQPAKKAAAD
jgi:N-formylglutamate amidohydrolase